MAFSFGGQSSAAQSAGGFSFGSSTGGGGGGLFGSSSAFSFGGSSAAASNSSFSNPFGQPASSASSFFGASSPSLFGASSTPSLFGASSSAFSFSSPSLFGASSQSASASSLFGGNSKPAFGGFGQQASSAAQAGGLFGNTQSQLVLGGFPSGVAPGQPDFSALKELESINNTCEPSSPQCKFTYLFLNMVDNPAARVKPPNVDELQWRAALQRAGGLNNPDRLWPVQAKGFKDLLARKNAQDEAIQEYSTRLEAAEQASRHLARKQQTLIRDRIDSVRRRHLELSHMLLRIMRHIDALEGRFAASQGHWDLQAQRLVVSLANSLRALENAIAPNSAGGLQRKVEALATAAKLREGGPGPTSDIPGLDENSLAKLHDYLARQATGIATLQDRLSRDARDASILEKAPAKAI